MTKDDKMMKILSTADIDIKRSAVIVMLEDGILTEERQFQDYVAAKNVYNALTCLEKGKSIEEAKELLTDGLIGNYRERIVPAFEENIRSEKE